MSNWIGALSAVGIIIMVVMACYGGYRMLERTSEKPQSIKSNLNLSINQDVTIEPPEQCKGLDLVLTAECLQKEEAKFFNYTIRDDLDRSLDDIKTFGGDCYDYNLLYKKWMKALGFKAELIAFTLNNETSHAITLAYDDHSYCILDQTVHPSCVIIVTEDQK